MSIFLSNFQSIVRAWNLQMQKTKVLPTLSKTQHKNSLQQNTYYSVLLCELMMD